MKCFKDTQLGTRRTKVSIRNMIHNKNTSVREESTSLWSFFLNSSFTLIDWESICVVQIFVQVNGIWGKWKMTGGMIFAWSKTNKLMSFSTRWRQYHYVLGDSSKASFCIILCPGPVVTSVECEAWRGNDTSQMTPQPVSRVLRQSRG